MEERVGPTDEAHILHPNNDDHLYPLSPKTDTFDSPRHHSAATYVVQVPKDQIYRVPPPENAAIAERHRNEHPANKAAASSAAKSRPGRRTCAARCCCAFIVTVAILLLLGLAASLLSSSLNPKLPAFSVEEISAAGAQSSDRAFEATVRSDNPNSRLDFSYVNKGGAVSLWVEKSEVAAGRFPAFYHAHGSSAVLEIPLRRTAAKEITSKAKSTKLRLTMNDLEARKEVWTWNIGSVEFNVECDVTVDSFTPKNSSTSRVLYQECRSTKHD